MRLLASFFFAAILLSQGGLAAVGSAPRYVEEIVVGGGLSDSGGGLEIDKSGNLDTTGYVSPASVKLRQGSYRATITVPALTVNRAITVPDAAGEISLLGQGISSDEIDDGTIVAADLSANAVSGSNIQDGSIAAVDLASDSVTSAKIQNGTIVAIDLASDSVTNPKLADNAVGTAELASGAVTSDKLADGAVGTAKIANDAVTAQKIAADAVGASEIAGDAVGTSEIAADAVGASEIAAGAVGASEIGSGVITNTHIASGANIALGKLAPGTEGYVIKTVGGVATWAANSGGSGSVTGPVSSVDNAIARWHGTGGDALQGYTSNTPTISDNGEMFLPGGLTADGQVTIAYTADNSRPLRLAASTSPATWYYRGGTASTNLRWIVGNSGGSETGALGGNEFYYQVYDHNGNYSHDALLINANPALGIRVQGTSGTKRDLYVDGVYYGANDRQLTSSAGWLLPAALDTTGAGVGSALIYNGVTVGWGTGFGNVNNAGGGTDNHVARFNLSGTSIQDSNLVVDDSGNVSGVANFTATGTITAPAPTTSLASLNLPHGTAPSAPSNGDLWGTTSGLYYRTNGTTVGPLVSLATISGLTDSQVADLLTISGGTVNNTPIGGTTPSTGAFTTLSATGNVSGSPANWRFESTRSTGVPTIDVDFTGASITDEYVRFFRNSTTGGTGALLGYNPGTATNTWSITSSTGAGAFGALSAVGVTSTGAVAVNSSSGITTNQTTFPLVNTTATTVNFAGAATALNMGASGGTISTPSSILKGTDSTQFKIQHAPASGQAQIRFSPIPINTSTAAAVDFFRETNTTTTCQFLLKRGDNTNTNVLVATVGTSPSFVLNNASGTQQFAVDQTTGNLDTEGTITAGSGNNVLTNASGTLRMAAWEQNGATTGQVPQWTGSGWAPTTPTTGASSSGIVYWQDFLGSVLPADWVNTASGTGAGGVFGIDANGIYEVQGGTGTNSNDRLVLGDYASSARPFQRGKNVTLEVGLIDSNIDTGDSIFVGLFYDSYPFEGALTSKARACFAVVDGSNSNKWIGVTADGSVTNNNGTAVSPGGAQILKIVATSSDVKFYINGALVATNSTNMPTTTTPLFICVQAYNTNGGTNPKCKIDYISILQGR